MENFVELFVLELVQIYVGQSFFMLYVLIAKRKLTLFTGELKESCGENNLSTIWSSLDFVGSSKPVRQIASLTFLSLAL